MCEVNCTNCRVAAFKHGLCPDDFCEKHKALGTEDDFIKTLQPKPHWIPVTERLPEPRTDVWVNSDLGQMVAYYDETIGTWYGRDYLELIVNAWMPLPEPYAERRTDEQV